MQVCTSLQTDNHASTPPLSVFTGRMPFLPPNQQHQSTEGLGYACALQKNQVQRSVDSKTRVETNGQKYVTDCNALPIKAVW